MKPVGGGNSPWGRSMRDKERESKRDAVLRTAARLFTVHGYHGTSLDLVAEELEITRPTVYYYFKNKDEILFECVRMALEMIKEAAQEVTARGGTAAEQLVAVMHKYAEVVTMEFGMCLVLVGDVPLPADSRAKLRKLQSNLDLMIRSLITKAMEQGSFAARDAKLAAFTIAGALNSISRWYRPDGPLTQREISEHVVALLMQGLQGRDTELPVAVRAVRVRSDAQSAPEKSKRAASRRSA